MLLTSVSHRPFVLKMGIGSHPSFGSLLPTSCGSHVVRSARYLYRSSTIVEGSRIAAENICKVFPSSTVGIRELTHVHMICVVFKYALLEIGAIELG